MKARQRARLGERKYSIEYGENGEILLGKDEPLRPYPDRFTEALERWAWLGPDRVFLAERDGEGWRTVSYSEALARIERIGQALLQRPDLGPDRPIMILSPSTIDNALLGLAALHVGLPYSPVSLGYVTLSSDYARLQHAFDILNPGMVYVSDASRFSEALMAVVPERVEIVAGAGALPDRDVTPYAALLADEPGDAVTRAKASVTGDTVGKILFSSGSSANPKGVINTHRMLCSNARMHGQVWRFLQDRPPVTLDWAPWSHTLGSNMVMGIAMFHGGAIYIDDGSPTPEGIKRTVENLISVEPNFFLAVPGIYQLLLPHLREDAALRAAFFGRMQVFFYAGASLPEKVYADLRDLVHREMGRAIFTTSGFGATETAPTTITCTWDPGKSGILGLPMPGTQVKLVPNEGRYELRVKGPNVTPGYWRNPEATKNAFDADGWYCMGDSVQFANKDDPMEGLVFEGRLSENFKLVSGTWVAVAPLRAHATEMLAPVVNDVVVTGEGRDELGLVLFPILEQCRKLPGCEGAAGIADLLRLPPFRKFLQDRLDALIAEGSGSSTRLTRAVVIDEDPSGMELTDKKTLSFAAVLKRRCDKIRALHDGEEGPEYFYGHL
ncbi:feruloyl-CoA synthase [Salipiger sp. P9]|uniref:feruloyl-CoA synthase n=1 Tax=Salipiger pentaromativorans TaxID=2943193 RepID=UPI00215726EF|nr:feruloyl-CoA synthase [Salipiger pentaromativorans]MCR8547585.1 feruloyl-CoA synthase [Salipiger pentaromativorans]